MNKEMITALVDGEIQEKSLQEEVLQAIASDKSLAVDYKIQLLVKNLIRDKVKVKPTPDYIREKILGSIASQLNIKESRKSFFTELFEKPAFTFATAVVVILAIVLILFNRPGNVETKNFAIEQSGSDNMFVQAKNNFQSIVEGKLAPQLVSSNPDEIKNFFAAQGVKYQTYIPNISDWKLVGAVVSEDKGEKFAHHVYVDKNNNLIYLFQVDESYLNKNKIISLSNDLVNYLDQGHCYTTVSDGKVTLLTKENNNIFAVVSNADLSEIENNFCNIN